jgi:hypothetical protein
MIISQLIQIILGQLQKKDCSLSLKKLNLLPEIIESYTPIEWIS